jgi:2-polyprenyl-3-methyl-5-hydroxy-6-metoxy-1,4-benzoquinol methylase
MKDFDYQWKNLPDKNIEYNNDRIAEFLNFTKLSPEKFIEKKYCLDAGCGIGRYSYAMMKLGAKQVDSIDISEEGVKKCKSINPNTEIKNILELKPNKKYDFVLSWGVLHHTSDPRVAFSKVASQVKQDGGYLHVMLYHKDTQKYYEEGRKIWKDFSKEQRLEYCKKKVTEMGWGTIHGWYDALNPKYNFSYSENEIKKWFEEEGFKKIKLISKYNINMSGQFLTEKTHSKSFLTRLKNYN